MSEDPIGLKAGDANYYRYVMNNPLMFRDPSGKYTICIPMLVGALLGTQIKNVQAAQNALVNAVISSMAINAGVGLAGTVITSTAAVTFAPVAVTIGLIAGGAVVGGIAIFDLFDSF